MNSRKGQKSDHTDDLVNSEVSDQGLAPYNLPSKGESRNEEKGSSPADETTAAMVGYAHSKPPSYFEQMCNSYHIPWISPDVIVDHYSNVLQSFADNTAAATDLVNKLTVLNIDSIQFMSDTAKQYCRLLFNTVKK